MARSTDTPDRTPSVTPVTDLGPSTLRRAAVRPSAQEDVSMPPIKKIVLWLVVIFLLYAILTSPTEAANIFGAAWNIIVYGVSNVAAFFDNLIGG
jgi:hypothetical protein